MPTDGPRATFKFTSNPAPDRIHKQTRLPPLPNDSCKLNIVLQLGLPRVSSTAFTVAAACLPTHRRRCPRLSSSSSFRFPPSPTPTANRPPPPPCLRRSSRSSPRPPRKPRAGWASLICPAFPRPWPCGRASGLLPAWTPAGGEGENSRRRARGIGGGYSSMFHGVRNVSKR